MTTPRIGVVTLLPTMFTALDQGITGRALRRGLVSLSYWNPRDYSEAPHYSVDDRPYGGGPGMVMKFSPLKQAIAAAKDSLGHDTPVLHLSPQGKPLQQADLSNIGKKKDTILLCGRYEGIDERLITACVDEEWSIGDFIVSGGELPAMMLIDALIRLIPGALGHAESAHNDSFSNGLLDYPHYTRPALINGQRVPEVLQNGDHKKISRWRRQQALGRTWQRRPDLLQRLSLERIEQELLDEYITELTVINEPLAKDKK